MEEINRRVGAAIKRARKERGLSREQVARRLGVSQQCIEKYEKGKTEISVRRLGEISNILNVGITYFLLEKDGDLTAFNYFVAQQVKLHLKD